MLPELPTSQAGPLTVLVSAPLLPDTSPLEELTMPLEILEELMMQLESMIPLDWLSTVSELWRSQAFPFPII